MVTDMSYIYYQKISIAFTVTSQGLGASNAVSNGSQQRPYGNYMDVGSQIDSLRTDTRNPKFVFVFLMKFDFVV